MQVTTPDQMTSKERGVLALTLYNNALNNYNIQFAATPQPMTQASKDYFKAYKKVMEVAWPVISAYTAVVNIGGVPTPEQEAELLKFIYQLQAMLMQGVQK
jgi:hypothetical protein